MTIGIAPFATVWHIWWLAIGSAIAILVATAVRSFDDDTEFRMPASEVAAIDGRRLEALERAQRRAVEEAPVLLTQPLPSAAT
jgi:hypothetical protein